MKLDEWIRQDMTQYIKEREPDLPQKNSVRQEDYGLVARADYEKRIKRALEQGRFKEATKQFNELKNHFLHLPTDHQEERKHYYRILQKSYKEIYDWVEDRHKTHRLLQNLDDQQDVFDENIQPKNLEQEATNPEMAPPSIEERMFRKKPQLPQQDDTTDIHLPAPEDNLFGQEETSQPPEAISMPEAPKETHAQKQEPTPKQPTPTPPKQPPTQLTPENQAHAPTWNPPQFDFTPKKPRTKTPQPTINEQQIKQEATKELLKQAKQAIQEQNPQEAKTKLLEARYEAMQTRNNDLLLAVEELERALAKQNTTPPHPRSDKELFSKLYLQGVRALQAGDYKTAAQLFNKRLQQAPRDHAARIRQQECLEALHGKTA